MSIDALSLTPDDLILPVGLITYCAELADAHNGRLCEDLNLDPGPVDANDADPAAAETVDAANRAHATARKLYAIAEARTVKSDFVPMPLELLRAVAVGQPGAAEAIDALLKERGL